MSQFYTLTQILNTSKKTFIFTQTIKQSLFALNCSHYAVDICMNTNCAYSDKDLKKLFMKVFEEPHLYNMERFMLTLFLFILIAMVKTSSTASQDI